ncbi:capping complex subunit for YIEGIA [Paenibacillus harenae]|uniref:Uncharacterized protein n=1 Tax=Paenibacillus harenae TaxID=306543 RepID=A0ABT9TW14_PAEHA|nr:hypothetical protein [Paenibacillus harenae]MDQ0058210.1 hypothetical protein [Paenibacillus harenae]MDQ0111555.1 hypothetical protein [Paenibacillus harenae]
MAKIAAIVTMHERQVEGGAPTFIVEDEKALEDTSFLLEKILDASAHDLKNGTYILVHHH